MGNWKWIDEAMKDFSGNFGGCYDNGHSSFRIFDVDLTDKIEIIADLMREAYLTEFGKSQYGQSLMFLHNLEYDEENKILSFETCDKYPRNLGYMLSLNLVGSYPVYAKDEWVDGEEALYVDGKEQPIYADLDSIELDGDYYTFDVKDENGVFLGNSRINHYDTRQIPYENLPYTNNIRLCDAIANIESREQSEIERE